MKICIYHLHYPLGFLTIGCNSNIEEIDNSTMNERCFVSANEIEQIGAYVTIILTNIISVYKALLQTSIHKI